MNRSKADIKITADDINKISNKKIYFGHQSVGYNIIDGMMALLPADSGINIKETSDIKDFSRPVFAHSQNGENFKPETKIAAFIKKMDSGLGNKVDIAFFKFCYVDINAGTDVNKLFAEYKKSMDMIEKKYSKTLFLHITAPLTAETAYGIKNKIKAVIKSVIGKIPQDVNDNIKRMEFNALIKKEYSEKVFDISAIESTDASGEMILSNKGRTKHPTLLHQYTNDGGHINQRGSRLVSSRFLQFIARQL